MRRSRKSPAPALKDAHLWQEVARTVTPLRPTKAMPESPSSPEQGTQRPPTFRPSRQTSEHGFVSTAHLRQSEVEHPGSIEPRLKRRLQRGQIAIDASIDLHGMTQEQAHRALQRFVSARQAAGDRTLLVITGKGLKKIGYGEIAQKGILRAMLPVWLTQQPLASLVSGWESAGRTHGGEGAYYVRLKRGRK